MDVQFNCVIEKASVEEEKMSFSPYSVYDAVRVKIERELSLSKWGHARDFTVFI